MPTCYHCQKEIFFDDNFVSNTGKKIPLTKASGRPHRCKARPFNKYTRYQYWLQQEQLEQEKWDREHPEEVAERLRKEAEEAKRKQEEEQRRKQDEERREKQRQEYWNRQKQREQEQKQQIYNVNINAQQRYCQVLGLSPNLRVSKQELKKLFRKLILQYHPDRNHNSDATEKTREIIEAYEYILSNKSVVY